LTAVGWVERERNPTPILWALHLCGMIWIYAQNFFLIYQ